MAKTEVMFHNTDTKDIIDGKITDVYFERTLKTYIKGINPTVKAEFIAKNFQMVEWGAAGMEEVIIC